MRYIAITLFVLFLYGCTVPVTKDSVYPRASSEQSIKPTVNGCLGTVELPAEFVDLFDVIEDRTLLDSALGAPNKGGLCQGKVYKAKKNIRLFRAWNSTNAKSRLGKWWAFSRPNGKMAQYRHDYEICYQWSPLDKLIHCQLKAGAKVVVGTGQSAECSEYLSYPVSAAQQIYIKDAAMVFDCRDYDGIFSWQLISK